MANKAGVSQQLIGEIETGRTRSTKAIYKIAHALGTAASLLDSDIPAIEGLYAKIMDDLKELSEEDALYLLQSFASNIEFTKNRGHK